MHIVTIEDYFEHQAKQIIEEVIADIDENDMDPIVTADDLSEMLWDKYSKELGMRFLERLFSWSGDDVFDEILNEMKEAE